MTTKKPPRVGAVFLNLLEVDDCGFIPQSSTPWKGEAATLGRSSWRGKTF